MSAKHSCSSRGRKPRNEGTSQRRSGAACYVDGISDALAIERSTDRVDVLSKRLREAQDARLDYLSRAARYLDEGDPTLLDNPAYARDLWAQFRREAPAPDDLRPTSSEQKEVLEELLKRIEATVDVVASKADLLAEASSLSAIGEYQRALTVVFDRILDVRADSSGCCWSRHNIRTSGLSGEGSRRFQCGIGHSANDILNAIKQEFSSSSAAYGR